MNSISSRSASITISFPDGQQVIVPDCEVTFEISQEMIDATTFGDTNRTFIAGIRRVSGTFEGGGYSTDPTPAWDMDPTDELQGPR